MKEKSFITKKDSKALYGIAILFMVFHHCFCIPSRLHNNYIPVLGNFEFEARIAYIGKLCVAIFAFITGYALAKQSTVNGQCNLVERLKDNIVLSIKQLLRFYPKFWLVYIIFIPIGILFYDYSTSPISLIKSFFLGGVYNGEWWYVRQYLKFIILFPFFEILIFSCSKHRKQVPKLIVLLLLGITLLLLIRALFWKTIIGEIVRFFINHFYSDYLIIFLTAFIIAYFNFFEFLNSKIHHPVIWACFLLLIVISVRYIYVTAPGQSDIDVFLTPFLIFALTNLLHQERKPSHFCFFLRLMGKYSTFIWLTHTFWLYYYFQKVVLLPKYSILIYVWSVLLSLGTAIILNFVDEKFRKSKLYLKILNYITSLREDCFIASGSKTESGRN